MSVTDRNLDRALLVLRLALGIVFIAHGYLKLFVLGHAGVEGYFTELGVPMPGIAAWGVSLLEFGGGILLVTGIGARVLSLLFIADMLGAIIFAVHSDGFVGGYELEFMLAAGSLAIALAGAGAYSRLPGKVLMLFMVIEHFRDGNPVPVYSRYRELGRLAPPGLTYVNSWVTDDLTRCYQVMACDDRALLDEWIAAWADLVEFDVIPVITSSDAAARVPAPAT